MSQQVAIAKSNPFVDALIRRFPLASFLVLAFAFTWVFLIADALGSRGWIPFRLATEGPGLVITLLTGYGPTIAALIVAGTLGGRAGVGKLLRRLLIWRVGIQWYAVAILGPALVFFVASQLYVVSGGTLRQLPPAGPVEIAVNLLALFVVSAVINGEELGWRGFALPRLQNKMNALASSLVLGFIWALFHLPLFFTQGGGAGGNQASMPPVAFFVQVMAMSVVVTWVFNHTRGSVLPAYLFHASVNTVSQVWASSTPDPLYYWLVTGLCSAAAVIVVAVYGASNLSRTTARVSE